MSARLSESRVASSAIRLARGSRWLRLFVRLAALALLVFLALRLHQLWRQQPVDLSGADVRVLALAAIISFIAVVAYGAVWPFILRRIGSRAPNDAVRLFLQSQLGKYLPGGVWHYAGRVGLARARGVPVRSAMLSLGIEVAASALAAGIVGYFVLPITLAATLAIATLVALILLASDATRLPLDLLMRIVRRVVRMPVADLRPTLRVLPGIVVLYLPVWAVYGVAFWLAGRAFFPIPLADVLFFTAAFALAWLVGMVVVFAPGGIGVREAVLVGLLAPRVGEADAIVIAAVSRILLTSADLVGGTAALALSRLQTRRLGF